MNNGPWIEIVRRAIELLPLLRRDFILYPASDNNLAY
jgi:hypothetical protein